ncbi:hypothetical protein [Faecalicatena contorta]|uniref:hypothetical protein n=1 Tax=Faecalicatena contorta TaxID=39482 RepID=UPI001F3B7826|nr:hypothetical protein [Faecalicatena contorta]MCF2667550.1 hypothetical protein [Faecalicatena contorta]
MKNKKAKKVMAGSMAVVIAAGLAGTYGYYNHASEVQAEEDTEVLQETAEQVLGDSDTGDDGEFYKEESVYVKADASGHPMKTTVTEWLKNPEKGTFEDSTKLNDIKNIKGEESFNEGTDGSLQWQSEGNDIYYQGTIDKELPVDVKVSYKLDGESISPEELEGKDGKLEIHFEYENKSKETVDVGGENAEMYTPFTMVTAMMLPTDGYKNVTIDNGKIISDADKDIIVGVAFPGLEENMNLQNLDVDIPDSVTITADVEDASVEPTITLASAELLNEIDLDNIDSFDDLEGSIEQLEDATNQLVEGSKSAADGAKELADGSKTLSDGVNTLNDKSGELASGMNTLADGVNAYVGGVSQLASGSTSVANGAAALKSGAQTAQAGISSAKVGADQLVAGYTGVGTETGVGVVAAAKSISDGITVLNNTLSENTSLTLSPAQEQSISDMAYQMAEISVKNIPEDTFTNLKTTKTVYISNLSGQYEELLKSQFTNTMNQTADTVKSTIKDNIRPIVTGAPALAAGVKQLYAGTVDLQNGLSQLNDGSTSLVQGTSDLYEGAIALQQGAAKLNERSSLLSTGTQSLKAGGSQLTSGVGQLADGAGQVADGASALADGNQQLSDGMAEYKESAIDKLTELFNGDIQNVTSRIDAMKTLSRNYKSFAGIKDGVNGSTKFIIETEGID